MGKWQPFTDESVGYAWTVSDLRCIFKCPNRLIYPVAKMIEDGVLSIAQERYDPPDVDEHTVFPLGNESMGHALLKIYAMLWLESIGESDIKVEEGIACGIMDVVSNNYVVECGKTEASRLMECLVYTQCRNRFVSMPHCSGSESVRIYNRYIIGVVDVHGVEKKKEEHFAARMKAAEGLHIPWERPDWVDEFLGGRK